MIRKTFGNKSGSRAERAADLRGSSRCPGHEGLGRGFLQELDLSLGLRVRGGGARMVSGNGVAGCGGRSAHGCSGNEVSLQFGWCSRCTWRSQGNESGEAGASQAAERELHPGGSGEPWRVFEQGSGMWMFPLGFKVGSETLLDTSQQFPLANRGFLMIVILKINTLP